MIIQCWNLDDIPNICSFRSGLLYLFIYLDPSTFLSWNFFKLKKWKEKNMFYYYTLLLESLFFWLVRLWWSLVECDTCYSWTFISIILDLQVSTLSFLLTCYIIEILTSDLSDLSRVISRAGIRIQIFPDFKMIPAFPVRNQNPFLQFSWSQYRQLSWSPEGFQSPVTG